MADLYKLSSVLILLVIFELNHSDCRYLNCADSENSQKLKRSPSPNIKYDTIQEHDDKQKVKEEKIIDSNYDKNIKDKNEAVDKVEPPNVKDNSDNYQNVFGNYNEEQSGKKEDVKIQQDTDASSISVIDKPVEIKEDIKVEIKEEIKEEIKKEAKEKIKEEIKEEAKEEIKETVDQKKDEVNVQVESESSVDLIDSSAGVVEEKKPEKQPTPVEVIKVLEEKKPIEKPKLVEVIDANKGEDQKKVYESFGSYDKWKEYCEKNEVDEALKKYYDYYYQHTPYHDHHHDYYHEFLEELPYHHEEPHHLDHIYFHDLRTPKWRYT